LKEEQVVFSVRKIATCLPHCQFFSGYSCSRKKKFEYFWLSLKQNKNTMAIKKGILLKKICSSTSAPQSIFK
jgi:hypothetical protein